MWQQKILNERLRNEISPAVQYKNVSWFERMRWSWEYAKHRDPQAPSIVNFFEVMHLNSNIALALAATGIFAILFTLAFIVNLIRHRAWEKIDRVGGKKQLEVLARQIEERKNKVKETEEFLAQARKDAIVAQDPAQRKAIEENIKYFEKDVVALSGDIAKLSYRENYLRTYLNPPEGSSEQKYIRNYEAQEIRHLFTKKLLYAILLNAATFFVGTLVLLVFSYSFVSVIAILVFALSFYYLVKIIMDVYAGKFLVYALFGVIRRDAETPMRPEEIDDDSVTVIFNPTRPTDDKQLINVIRKNVYKLIHIKSENYISAIILQAFGNPSLYKHYEELLKREVYENPDLPQHVKDRLYVFQMDDVAKPHNIFKVIEWFNKKEEKLDLMGKKIFGLPTGEMMPSDEQIRSSNGLSGPEEDKQFVRVGKYASQDPKKQGNIYGLLGTMRGMQNLRRIRQENAPDVNGKPAQSLLKYGLILDADNYSDYVTDLRMIATMKKSIKNHEGIDSFVAAIEFYNDRISGFAYDTAGSNRGLGRAMQGATSDVEKGVRTPGKYYIVIPNLWENEIKWNQYQSQFPLDPNAIKSEDAFRNIFGRAAFITGLNVFEATPGSAIDNFARWLNKWGLTFDTPNAILLHTPFVSQLKSLKQSARKNWIIFSSITIGAVISFVFGFVIAGITLSIFSVVSFLWAWGMQLLSNSIHLDKQGEKTAWENILRLLERTSFPKMPLRGEYAESLVNRSFLSDPVWAYQLIITFYAMRTPGVLETAYPLLGESMFLTLMVLLLQMKLTGHFLNALHEIRSPAYVPHVQEEKGIAGLYHKFKYHKVSIDGQLDGKIYRARRSVLMLELPFVMTWRFFTAAKEFVHSTISSMKAILVTPIVLIFGFGPAFFRDQKNNFMMRIKNQQKEILLVQKARIVDPAERHSIDKEITKLNEEIALIKSTATWPSFKEDSPTHTFIRVLVDNRIAVAAFAWILAFKPAIPILAVLTSPLGLTSFSLLMLGIVVLIPLASDLARWSHEFNIDPELKDLARNRAIIGAALSDVKDTAKMNRFRMSGHIFMGLSFASTASLGVLGVLGFTFVSLLPIALLTGAATIFLAWGFNSGTQFLDGIIREGSKMDSRTAGITERGSIWTSVSSGFLGFVYIAVTFMTTFYFSREGVALFGMQFGMGDGTASSPLPAMMISSNFEQLREVPKFFSLIFNAIVYGGMVSAIIGYVAGILHTIKYKFQLRPAHLQSFTTWYIENFEKRDAASGKEYDNNITATIKEYMILAHQQNVLRALADILLDVNNNAFKLKGEDRSFLVDEKFKELEAAVKEIDWEKRRKKWNLRESDIEAIGREVAEFLKKHPLKKENIRPWDDEYVYETSAYDKVDSASHHWVIKVFSFKSKKLLGNGSQETIARRLAEILENLNFQSFEKIKDERSGSYVFNYVTSSRVQKSTDDKIQYVNVYSLDGEPLAQVEFSDTGVAQKGKPAFLPIGAFVKRSASLSAATVSVEKADHTVSETLPASPEVVPVSEAIKESKQPEQQPPQTVAAQLKDRIEKAQKGAAAKDQKPGQPPQRAKVRAPVVDEKSMELVRQIHSQPQEPKALQDQLLERLNESAKAINTLEARSVIKNVIAAQDPRAIMNAFAPYGLFAWQKEVPIRGAAWLLSEKPDIYMTFAEHQNEMFAGFEAAVRGNTQYFINRALKGATLKPQQVEVFASRIKSLSSQEKALLALALSFHDFGRIVTTGPMHPVIGGELVAAILSKLGYDQKTVALISNLTSRELEYGTLPFGETVPSKVTAGLAEQGVDVTLFLKLMPIIYTLDVAAVGTGKLTSTHLANALAISNEMALSGFQENWALIRAAGFYEPKDGVILDLTQPINTANIPAELLNEIRTNPEFRTFMEAISFQRIINIFREMVRQGNPENVTKLIYALFKVYQLTGALFIGMSTDRKEIADQWDEALKSVTSDELKSSGVNLDARNDRVTILVRNKPALSFDVNFAAEKKIEIKAESLRSEARDGVSRAQELRFEAESYREMVQQLQEIVSGLRSAYDKAFEESAYSKTANLLDLEEEIAMRERDLLIAEKNLARALDSLKAEELKAEIDSLKREAQIAQNHQDMMRVQLLLASIAAMQEELANVQNYLAEQAIVDSLSRAELREVEEVPEIQKKEIPDMVTETSKVPAVAGAQRAAMEAALRAVASTQAIRFQYETLPDLLASVKAEGLEAKFTMSVVDALRSQGIIVTPVADIRDRGEYLLRQEKYDSSEIQKILDKKATGVTVAVVVASEADADLAKQDFGAAIEVIVASDDALDAVVESKMAKMGIRRDENAKLSVIQLDADASSMENEAAALLEGFVVIAKVRRALKWSTRVSIDSILKASFEAARAIGVSA
jgi:hypothetical protein